MGKTTKLKPETSKALSDMETLAAVVERAHRIAVAGEILPEQPPRSVSSAQYARIKGCSVATAEDQLKRCIRLGTHERVRAYAETPDGRVIPVFFYREKGNGISRRNG